MGLGSSLKKVTKSVKKTWKKTLGWADDKWAKTAAAAVGGGIVGLAAYSAYEGMRDQEKAQKAQLAAMQDIANRQAAAAAVPVATSTAAQQTVSADTADVNYATERRRAMSMADTRTSQRLQRWAKNGKRRTL